MSSLYELNEAIANFQMEFDEETGEWINEADLDELQMVREEKIEQLCLWVKNIRAEADMVKAEKQKFDDRYKRLVKKADSIEGYIASALNGAEFATSKVEVKWRKSEKVIIDDDYAVPDNYVNLTLERKPDKTAIKKFLKRAEAAGEEVPWARLEKKNNMSIK